MKKRIILFFAIFLLLGCLSFKDEEKITYIPEDIKPVEVGAPVEKVIEEKIQKSEPAEEKKEVVEEKESGQEEKKIEEKQVCEKDTCMGNILQHCVFGKATFNSTCTELCKDGKCVEKSASAAEEFTFADLALGKNIGTKKQILTENDLKMLASTKTSTPNGLLEIKYLLRFAGDTDDPVESGTIVYEKNEGNLGDYFSIKKGEDLFEYLIDFNRGLESTISADKKLDEIIGVSVNFFGMQYYIVDAETDQKGITLRFLRGTQTMLLDEGTTQSITHDGKNYEVNVIMVDAKNDKVRVSIDGKISPDLKLGSSFSSDGLMRLAVKDIFTNNDKKGEKEVAEFFVGADQIEITDNDATNTQFERNVRVHGVPLERGKAQIRANMQNGKMRIEMIKYRTDLDEDLFIAPGESVRNKFSEKEALLTKNWDLAYDGLSAEKNEKATLRHRNARTYELSFVNGEDEEYTFPFMDITNTFTFGDDDNALVFMENAPIKQNDYLIMTSTNTENGLTKVYQLTTLDKENKKINLRDLAGATRDASYTVDAAGAGAGSISLGGRNHNFIVSGNTLLFDLNGNGNIGNDRMMIVATGGLLIDLGTTQDISSKTSHDITLTTMAQNLKDHTGNEDVKMTVTKGNEISFSLPDQAALHLHSTGTDILKGITSYGALYEVTGSAKKELSLEYPLKQRLAKVKLSVLG